MDRLVHLAEFKGQVEKKRKINKHKKEKLEVNISICCLCMKSIMKKIRQQKIDVEQKQMEFRWHKEREIMAKTHPNVPSPTNDESE